MVIVEKSDSDRALVNAVTRISYSVFGSSEVNVNSLVEAGTCIENRVIAVPHSRLRYTRSIM